jgi:hypothetical protein
MATQGASSSCTRASFAVGKTDRISLGEEEVDDVESCPSSRHHEDRDIRTSCVFTSTLANHSASFLGAFAPA